MTSDNRASNTQHLQQLCRLHPQYYLRWQKFSDVHIDVEYLTISGETYALFFQPHGKDYLFYRQSGEEEEGVVVYDSKSEHGWAPRGCKMELVFGNNVTNAYFTGRILTNDTEKRVLATFIGVMNQGEWQSSHRIETDEQGFQGVNSREIYQNRFY
mmetsp:Transcript_5866/g.22262  ORF Transcript_5866/g.22262 Transcript_5866/m.22262 type:complete len:156 (+) Transcript_5866:1028-1495(+)